MNKTKPPCNMTKVVNNASSGVNTELYVCTA